MSIEALNIMAIRMDGDTQSRVAINEDAVADYASAIENGEALPAVVVFFNGLDHVLADGFHRLLAHKRIGCKTIDCDVRPGTLADAQLYAYGANQTHGLRRTNADKAKAVAGVLALRPDWSDRAVAKHVGVSHPMVAAMRNPERAEARAAARRKSSEAPKVESDSTPSNASSLPPAVPPAIEEQRKPGPVTTTGGPEDDADSEGGETDLEDSPADLLADMQRDLREAQAQVKALSEGDSAGQLLKALQRAEHAERRQAELMQEAARSQQRAAFYERQLARIGKAIGQKDLDQVAPAVEALVRATRKAAA